MMAGHGSWNHEIRPLVESDKKQFYAYRQGTHKTWEELHHGGGLYCSGGRRCEGQPTHSYTYSYVTGRRGRVSCQRRYLCTEHATAKANKLGVHIKPALNDRIALDPGSSEPFVLPAEEVSA